MDVSEIAAGRVRKGIDGSHVRRPPVGHQIAWKETGDVKRDIAAGSAAGYVTAAVMKSLTMGRLPLSTSV